MQTLRRVKLIFMDSTFRACPPSITSQLFTMHGLSKDEVLPILFGTCLLSRDLH
ncbi:hypothetical protein LSH36_75g12036 [Paralvinella palmiformis]|uniref:Uncharacterized protein n=1 Tax=Paralvinella palmiformis TaxID=53620 RepID=A0AAD9K2S8_9ANNE|nr:hypothetical protein LSH36_75g12036 [Paralvinella palmiformis]